MMELTKIQQKMFEKIRDVWIKRVGRHNVDDETIKKIVLMADTDEDGKKRVVYDGKTYLVPIEDIILYGLKAEEIAEKYEEEK